MIQKQKIKLLEVWRKENFFSEYSISKIMDLSNKKTKTWVFLSLKLLEKNKLIKSRRVGNMDLYSLNLDNPLCFFFLSFLEAEENLEFPFISLINEIIEISPVKDFSLIVFGSYAKKKQKKDSDLDICLLVKSQNEKKIILPYINEVKLNYPVEIDTYFITYPDFLKMLLNREENLGKQIFRKHIVFYNSGIYYNLLKEAYKNGFRQ